ncbi:uncharacterized protein LOC110688552 [Chenopodium quinoa]|uniref:uncharacterized protein LOC110688552 n=1 Tax=Chenopodium quinoa TaxID=63459 RepID=UPI000B778D13|nr:uncharacterized protein LOC110688552 [Chenopodium quinoa]
MSILRIKIGGVINQRKLMGGLGKRFVMLRRSSHRGSEINGNKYSIAAVYKWMQNSAEKVDWTDWIWNRYNIPKTSFIVWLAMLNKLKTRDTLMKLGISNTDRCLLCDAAVESHKHLFFYCQYSRRCLLLIGKWLGVREVHFDIQKTWKHWKRCFKDPIFRKISFASLADLVYKLWSVRNTAFWNHAIQIPEILCHKVCSEVVDRCHQLINQNWKRKHC